MFESGASTFLERLLGGENLTEPEAAHLLTLLTDERLPAAVAAAVLAALRAKGETAEEVRGFAGAMRRIARRPHVPRSLAAVDVVGTGGDGSGSLNLSTGSALLAAACGQPVVKHGNRSVSSRSGSADVLEALGLTLPGDEPAAGACLASTGFTFLFAPYFHPAMKAIAPVRRAMGVRTVFNILGPLTNPAEPPFAVIGAFSREAAELMAEALAGMPIRRAFVVHGTNGWDEATPLAPYLLYDVVPGSVVGSTRDPLDAGIPRCSVRELQGGDAEENAANLRAAFCGRQGAHRNALLLGTALALEVAGATPDLETGIDQAAAAIDDGSASELLDRLVVPAAAAWFAEGGS